MLKRVTQLFFAISFVIFFSLPTSAEPTQTNGLIIKSSTYSTTETLDKLTSLLNKKGITVFARINHEAGAAKTGQSLRSTELLIFGNPKLGTPLMQENQITGIDLPLKALAWQDANGQVWLGYNSPSYIANRHNIRSDNPSIINMGKALEKLTNSATQ